MPQQQRHDGDLWLFPGTMSGTAPPFRPSESESGDRVREQKGSEPENARSLFPSPSVHRNSRRIHPAAIRPYPVHRRRGTSKRKHRGYFGPAACTRCDAAAGAAHSCRSGGKAGARASILAQRRTACQRIYDNQLRMSDAALFPGPRAYNFLHLSLPLPLFPLSVSLPPPPLHRSLLPHPGFVVCVPQLWMVCRRY